MSDPARLVARLRAAGCVFAEEEAALLLEAAGAPAQGVPAQGVPTQGVPAGPAEPPWPVRLERLVARRVAGEPLEHVLGWVAFAGRRWAVAPGVFVPRQRSQHLVAEALRAARSGVDAAHGRAAGSACAHTGSAAPERARPLVVVDLCCGSGALGGAVASAWRDDGGDVVLHAVDLDPVATACAARNLAPLGGVVRTGDLDAPLPPALRGAVDVLVCHAPYVPTAAISLLAPEAREHEPSHALDGGADGLDILRRVIALAPRWLASSGALLFELGDDGQIAETARLLAAAGLRRRVTRDEESAAIVVTATRARPV
ncbi:putative protein N(5)-glutamine methyltransferase [Xylanimonas allomyrinae]|uniref:Methyltransferase small domain-containing protein n=1 Tax=Xylanimonas allomyrinae TaxID=2509459 RepID=A0A4P6EPX2_9MICO|nr:putative protein N(5)-glutamine methyltransferase [Xylanimonas allomyrinae]QAY63429.1 putative protein N(5)-glutamine methyltransferase [Xylanimonas allomyrinae]